MNQRVALKLYLNPDEDERVEKEIAAARQAKCETLTTVLASGRTTLSGIEYRFVVWEFIDGIALDQRLSAGPCVASQVAMIGRDVSLAVEALWSQRIVHRDVNPKNIMLRQGEESAVLIDLGLAKYVEQTALTAPGLVWGTSGYLSPEQLAATTLTCQSDIFSLGITLIQALAGNHPTGGNQARLFLQPIQTYRLCPSAPAALSALLDRMVNLRPARRPQLAELISEFSKITDGD